MTFQQIKVGTSVILTRKSIFYNYYFHDSMSSSMSKYDFYQIKLGTCVIPHFQWIWNGQNVKIYNILMIKGDLRCENVSFKVK